MNDLAWLAALLLYAGAMLSVPAGGYTGGDDRYYLQAVDAWSEGRHFIGNLHWQLRFPLLLSILAAFDLFGRTDFALMAPGSVSFLAAVALIYVLVRRIAAGPAAILAAVLVASTPVFTVWAKVAVPDMLEAFFSLLSFVVFLHASDAGRRPAVRRPMLSIAGAVLGTSWIMRESCASQACLYGVLMLAGWRMARLSYGWLWAGFVLPIGLDTAYFAINTGNPLYRYIVEGRQNEVPSAHLTGGVAKGLNPPFNWQLMAQWIPNSYVDVHWTLNPYIDLLTNVSHGFLCLLALFAVRPVLRAFPRRSEAGQILRVLLLWIGCIVFTVVYVFNMRPQPRYFITLTGLCGIFVAIWAVQRAQHSRALVAAAVLAIVSIDLGAAWLRPDPMFAERWLVRYAASHPGPVWTTSGHIDAARRFLSESGLSDKMHAVNPQAAPPGAAYFLAKKETVWADVANWPVEWEHDRQIPVLQRLEPALPLALKNLKTLLTASSPGAVVLRVPSNGQQPRSD